MSSTFQDLRGKFQIPESRLENNDKEQEYLPEKTCEADVDSGLRTQNSGLSSQRWLCLSVSVPHEAAEAVANFLAELGSTGVIEGIRDFQQPAVTHTEVQGFFPEETSRTEVENALTQYLQEITDLFPNLDLSTLQSSLVRNEAWQNRWQEHFPPLEVGDRFLVLPPWIPVPTENPRIPLIIEPSMAFGTGHHATTQGCLEAIELLHDTYGYPHQALDLGTGAGILAIALAKLGTPGIFATDIDSVALSEARKNSSVNKVALCIHFSDLPLEQLPAPFELIVANLFSSTLVALEPSLHTGIERQGHAILSGIQLDQEQDVLAAYCPPTWRLIARFPREEWVTIVLQRW